jgi:hypothetical protein
MLWQIVGALPPRRLGADEDVQPGANDWIIVEQACRYAHCWKVWGLAWRGRATDTAKAPEAPGCGFETPHQIATRQQFEFAGLDVDVAGERCSRQLAAIGAMAMCQRAGCIDFEPNATAETGSPDHAKAPQPNPG